MPGAFRSARLTAVTVAVLAVPLASRRLRKQQLQGQHRWRHERTLPQCKQQCAAVRPLPPSPALPKSGTSLVVLADDKQSQNSDNIVPVVSTKLAKPPLTDALNAVSKALSQDALTTMNQAVSA